MILRWPRTKSRKKRNLASPSGKINYQQVAEEEKKISRLAREKKTHREFSAQGPPPDHVWSVRNVKDSAHLFEYYGFLQIIAFCLLSIKIL